MKKIAVVTATRAEYSLLSPVVRELRKQEGESLKVELVVTGTHLCEKYGMTVNEIEERIDHKIFVPVMSCTEQDISNHQAEVLVRFTRLFLKEKYHALFLLGDRYETLAIAIAAGNTRLPVFHLCGGDTTEGALDEWIRHCITKISYLHFVTNEDSRKRVVQLGEEPSRVFNYGSTSMDNILTIADLSRQEVLSSLGLKEGSYAVCTYHPATMEAEDVEARIHNVLEAIKAFPKINFIFTKSNADQGGGRMNELLDEAGKRFENLNVFASLGARRYLSLLRSAAFVLGNSSSGIIEAPAFQIPTVNIGDRQKGRLQPASVINCEPDSASIITAIKKALSQQHQTLCKSVVSPYGGGHAAEQIAAKAVEVLFQKELNLKKKFYALEE